MSSEVILAGVIKTTQFLGDLLLPCICRRDNPRFFTVDSLLHVEEVSDLQGLPACAGELHALASGIEPASLVRRFSKKKLATKDFFSDRENPVFEKMLMPFVWRQTDRMIRIFRDEEVPVYDARATWPNLYEECRIGLAGGRPEAKLHFHRTDDGTEYTLKVWYDELPVNLQETGNLLLGLAPCHLVNGQRLLSFDTHISGRLLGPFLKKESLHIPARLETKYFNTFIRKVVNHMDIQAEGFQVVDLDVQPAARLSVEQEWQGPHGLVLTFLYGERQVLANDRQQTFTTVEAGDAGFVFKRIRRDPTWEKGRINLLKALGLQQHGSFFRLPGEATRQTDIISCLIRHRESLLKDGFVIEQPGDQKFLLDQPQVEVKHVQEMDWFDLQIVVKANGVEIPFLHLKENILSYERVYRLPGGMCFLIPAEWFERYFGVMLHGRAIGDRMRFGRYHSRLLGDFLPPELVMPDPIAADDRISGVPVLHNGTLRPYQYFGFRWMRQLSGQGLGGILADDMGLGKTVQVIAMLATAYAVTTGGSRPVAPASGSGAPAGKQLSLFDAVQDITASTAMQNTATGNSMQDAATGNSLQDAATGTGMQDTATGNSMQDISASTAGTASREDHQPALVVMPTSIIYNWESELRRFAPQLNVLCYTGPDRGQYTERLCDYHVVLTSYGVMRNDIDLLRQVWFNYIVLDESQQIKNPSSQTAQAAFLLNGSHRFTLTGTPVENRLSDIWSQFHFVNPGMLGGLSDFKRYYGSPVEEDPEGLEAQRLRSLVAPFLLRRTKQQVEPELPPLTETTILCDMAEAQMSFYESEKSRFRNQVMETMFDEARRRQTPFLVLRALMRLRQLAIHPQLVDKMAAPESGKFQVIADQLETLLSEGHKVLMFSSFVRHLELFETYFHDRGIKYAKLTGATKRRDETIASFRNNSHIQVFLMSLKAGGVGLNLTEAGYVFLLDPWWNPAAEMQALSRAHRIGQDKNVFAYRFISKGTVEEKIVRLQQKKQQLTNTVVPQDQFVAGLTMEEITALFD